MEHYNLTPETLRNAKTYLPIAEKMAFVSDNAPKCFDRLQITNGDQQMPPMYCENTGLKSRYLMMALIKRYLGIEGDFSSSEDAELMSEAAYDCFAGGHILQQIDRYKREKTTQNAAYDLAADYYDLERRMNTQIRGLLDVQNDFVMRQQMIMSQSMAELPKLLEQLKGLQKPPEKGAVNG